MFVFRSIARFLDSCLRWFTLLEKVFSRIQSRLEIAKISRNTLIECAKNFGQIGMKCATKRRDETSPTLNRITSNKQFC